MFQFHEDKNFHYEIIRTLGLTRYLGADISEILAILPNIKPGDFESWFEEWNNLAKRVLSTIDESKTESYSPVTLREVYFRASHYFFTADFFLHGNPSDPRIRKAFELSRDYFDKAIALLPIPAQHALVETQYGFKVPIVIFRTSVASSTNPRPTLIMGGGFDSNIGELLHNSGFSALERGYNLVLYDGPGQPSLLHENIGWIPEWERVVSPVIDFLEAGKESGELDFIDTKKLGLMGLSLGGYLSARAAAFEPRLAALICVDGVISFEDTFFTAFTDCKAPWIEKDTAKFAANFENVSEKSSTNLRWIHDHLKYSMCRTDPSEIMQVVCKMTMRGIADKIKMPAFIGDAEEDLFFQGQPEQIAHAIGKNATLFKFGADQAAMLHCQSGALGYLNQSVFEWFSKIVD